MVTLGGRGAFTYRGGEEARLLIAVGKRRVYLSRCRFVRLAKPSQQKSSTATAESARSRYPISVITMVLPPDRSHRIDVEFVASAPQLSERPITSSGNSRGAGHGVGPRQLSKRCDFT